MKKLMFAMVTALSFAAMAQEGGPKPEGQEGPRGGDRAEMAGARPQMQRGMMGGGMGGMMGDPAVMAVMNPSVAEKLGLSEETVKQIRQLDTDHRKQVTDLQAKTRAAMEKQAKLMKAEKIDEAAVMAAIDELFDCRKEMAKAQTKRVIAVKALLTPEQLAKATEMMKTLRQGREGRRNQRQGAERGQKREGNNRDMQGRGKPQGDKPEGNPPEGGKPEGDMPPPPAAE